MFRSVLVLLFACLPVLCAQAQHPPDSLHRGRLNTLLLVKGGAYGGLLLGLHQLWYKDQGRTEFHFFNDSRDWQQMDKLGHAYSTYHLGRLHYASFRWAGMAPRKAALWSSLAGFAWLLPIEFLDGYSEAYGASSGDLVANASGALLWGSQQLLWEKQLLRPKFSFHPTRWAPRRTSLLGSRLHEQVLKDYNGQTYWLSADLSQLSGGRSPRWLNLALGYGASGMVYANAAQNSAQGYLAYRQWFLAPDLNLSHIRSNKRAVRWLLFVLDGIHLPAPALEWSRNRLHLHPVYF
ncbi:DUF2279 domain-containing protein [Cesiribacter andamanensis]|uniref:DUF2279 domain-containing protein n=1 Tax=Cesiribacter andamanensis AMV16 TaxID=1279009 RepID=M7N2T2_9BACT|nr:DUF2279 domain-containing protein [Cesiribacter andamanensis]EMR01607.1 hypothetical protein ADICEAN_03260 [Cesiribacter andamanensis AMV16]